MMNPALLFKFMGMKKEFKNRHPRVASFIKNELVRELPEGTVLEISVTRPGEEKVTCNMLLKEEDLELLKELKNMRNSE